MALHNGPQGPLFAYVIGPEALLLSLDIGAAHLYCLLIKVLRTFIFAYNKGLRPLL